MSSIGHIWISLLLFEGNDGKIYGRISVAIALPNYIISYIFYHKYLNIKNYYRLIWISMPLISPLFPYICGKSHDYTIPNDQFCKIIKWRLKMKYQHFGFIIHCISQIIWHCIFIIIKINVDTHSNVEILIIFFIFYIFHYYYSNVSFNLH